MIIKILASGSKGNSSYYESAQTKMLIDLGISYKRVKDVLNKERFDVENVNAVFITHEHSDHVNGVYTFLKRSSAKIYMTIGTLEALCKKTRGSEILEAYKTGQIIAFRKDSNTDRYPAIVINDLNIQPEESFHDAAEPCNYIIKDSDKKICLITDTGYIHRKQLSEFTGADCYIIETNHDPDILMSSDRPYPLKQRILGTNGHLSNSDSMFLLSKLITDNTKLVYYAHISDECNLFEIVEETRKEVFTSLGINTDNIKFVFTSQVSCEAIKL